MGVALRVCVAPSVVTDGNGMLPDMGDLTCSVVIPAYNVVAVIDTQLRALATQENAEPFEVIVVDNNSTDGTGARVAEVASALNLEVRVVKTPPQQGVSVARNTGVRAARTDLVLICDADDEVAPGWVHAMVAGLREHAFIGGPVETEKLSGTSATWMPMPARTSGLPAAWGVAYPFGGNTGFRREVFEAVGGYDEDYPAGAEEIDFAWLARDAGYEAAYVPDALLHYRIRTDLRGVLRQQFNSGQGTAQLYGKFRPIGALPKSRRSRLRHEVMLLRAFPLRGSRSEKARHAMVLAFEAGKLWRARKLGTPAP